MRFSILNTVVFLVVTHCSSSQAQTAEHTISEKKPAAASNTRRKNVLISTTTKLPTSTSSTILSTSRSSSTTLSTNASTQQTVNETTIDWEGGTTWSITKYPRRPPRTFGPTMGRKMTPKEIEDRLRAAKIIPDVIKVAPPDIMEITYDRKVSIFMGELYSALQLDTAPLFIEWPCDQTAFYTLIFTDPDSPIPEDPYQREFHHWIVGNIPGCHVRAGVTLSEYICPLPIAAAGKHRYVFLIYKQDKGRMKFDWEHRNNLPIDALRGDFNTEQFARNNSLSGPIAVNFFYANWEMTMTPPAEDKEYFPTEDW